MKKIVLVISILLTILVFLMSFVSGTSSDSMSSGITNAIYNIIGNIFPNNQINIDTLHIFIRKSAHITEYMLLSISWFYTIKLWNLSFSRLLLIGLLISSLDETIQIYAVDRGPSITDALLFDYLPFILMSSLLLLLNNRKGDLKMNVDTLSKLQTNEITPEIAYNELFKEDRIKRVPFFHRAHFIKLRINVPGEKGANTFLKVLFFLPMPIIFLRILLGLVKLDKYTNEDIPLSKREIMRMITHRKVRVEINTHSGEKILIKTI